MLTSVSDILKAKGDAVWHVTPTTPVADTLKVLAEKDIGALLVMDGERIAGIVSERDIVRKVSERDTFDLDQPVSAYMTRDVFTIGPEQTIEDCMAMMTEKRIRHLPVVEGEKLVGVISIGDVVKAIIHSQEYTIEQLTKYISGGGYNR